mmetsp:Transcript_20614/g.35131  ORF Transcript_20614/g.35131 Transcript_20614/m.35131 type:complete len:82 (-) Transcript_20614:1126-1371(-)
MPPITTQRCVSSTSSSAGGRCDTSPKYRHVCVSRNEEARGDNNNKNNNNSLTKPTITTNTSSRQHRKQRLIQSNDTVVTDA